MELDLTNRENKKDKLSQLNKLKFSRNATTNNILNDIMFNIDKFGKSNIDKKWIETFKDLSKEHRSKILSTIIRSQALTIKTKFAERSGRIMIPKLGTFKIKEGSELKEAIKRDIYAKHGLTFGVIYKDKELLKKIGEEVETEFYRFLHEIGFQKGIKYNDKKDVKNSENIL